MSQKQFNHISSQNNFTRRKPDKLHQAAHSTLSIFFAKDGTLNGKWKTKHVLNDFLTIKQTVK